MDSCSLAYQNMLGGFHCPPVTIWNPEEAGSLVLRNDLLTVQSSLPFFIGWDTHDLFYFPYHEFAVPSPPLAHTRQHLQRPPFQLRSPGELSLWTLGTRHQVPLVKMVALSQAHLSLTSVFLLCCFLNLFILSSLFQPAWSGETSNLRAFSIINIIGVMTILTPWGYCMDWLSEMTEELPTQHWESFWRN